VAGVRIAGLEVRDSAVALLAWRLQEKGDERLAFYFGHVIDHLHDHVALTARDRQVVLQALMDCPPELADLRATLLADDLYGRFVLVDTAGADLTTCPKRPEL
jgi:hypothetical protein